MRQLVVGDDERQQDADDVRLRAGRDQEHPGGQGGLLDGCRPVRGCCDLGAVDSMRSPGAARVRLWSCSLLRPGRRHAPPQYRPAGYNLRAGDWRVRVLPRARAHDR